MVFIEDVERAKYALLEQVDAAGEPVATKKY